MFYYTFLFDFNGNLGLYDNHVWGYHTFGSSISQTDRSTFNISDNGKNFYVGLRPYPATYTIQEIDTKFIYQQNALYPRDIYTYTGLADNPLVFYHVWYTFDDDNIQVNPYWLEDNYKDKPKALKALQEIKQALLVADWFDKSDIQSDYFHTAYYYHINVGKWNKPYELTK
jgi:hypothetical protein